MGGRQAPVRSRRGRAAHSKPAKAKPAAKKLRKGERARPAPRLEIETLNVDSPFGLRRPVRPLSAQVVPANQRVNNPAGDTGSAGQSEESIAALGQNVLAAWNDGQGFNVANGSGQGYGYSTDGGATWTDGGDPPAPAGFPSFQWTSDPVCVVNPTTGTFYYSGLTAPNGGAGSTNGVAVARGHFSGAAFVWDGVANVKIDNNATTINDKEWLAVDPASGNLYITCTTFVVGNDRIDFYRSTDGGGTWSGATQLSSALDGGYVQGSQVVVGPDGEVHTLWNAIDQVTADDNYRYRKSTNGGVSFASEVTAVKYYPNFGTGMPGYNRERGIQNPGMAVDRTNGSNRGRVYLTWAESINHQDENFAPAQSLSEVENNNFAAAANPTPLDRTLRGTLTNSADQDWWSFSLSAGQSVVAYVDSISSSFGYLCRFQAASPDTLQRLAFGGDLSPTDGVRSSAFLLFTAPATATYYLRMLGVSGSVANGRYRIRLVEGFRGVSERSRDQRDVFVCWSDNGTSWSTPTQVNDDGVGFDQFIPYITVGGDGMPWVKWYDHRDDTYGSRAHQYMSRSTDGGATWQANQRVTDQQTNFTTAPTNIAPNAGDYNGLTATATDMHATWADRRASIADIDVFHAGWSTDHAVAACANDTSITVNQSGTVGFTLQNLSAIYANDYTVDFTSQRNWPGITGAQNVNIAALGTAFVSKLIAVPDTAAVGTNQICLTMTNAKGTITHNCCFNVTVLPTVGVGPGGAVAFGLEGGQPNPFSATTRLSYTLPRDGRVSVQVYDLSGARVRTLVQGEQSAGVHEVRWNGTDDTGRRLQAGAYFVRLEGFGRTAERRLVLVR